MSGLMKAWRVYRFGDMRLDEIPIPQVKPGWALVKVRVVQPSVTEARWLRGEPTMQSATIKRMIEEHAPVQLAGHEFCGEIVDIGENVRRVQVGDRVGCRVELPCNRCESCLSGRKEDCRKGEVIGLHYPGCFAEYALVPDELMAPLPDNVTDNEGALIQPLTSCVQAMSAISLGDTVVVLGQGCMGTFIMQAARVSGAGTVIAVDVREETLALSRKLGADVVIDASKGDPVTQIMDFTRSVGADVVYDTAGGSPSEGLSGTKTLHQAIHMVRDSGCIVAISNFGEPSPVDLKTLRQKAASLTFARMVTLKTLDHTVKLVASGRIKVQPMISHILHGLDKAPEAFEITANKQKYNATAPAQVVINP